MIAHDFIDKFIEKILQYDKIAIFCHRQPDYDAYGSAYALYQWLNDNFHSSKKKIYLMINGADLTSNELILFSDLGSLPTAEELENSLAIILDTANEARIMTGLHVHCLEIINIDHHPKSETFAQLELVDPTYPATAQILAEIFEALEAKYLYTSKVAQYLYAGIITDTNNLLSPTVLPSTLEIVGRLVLKGINRNLVLDSVFLQTLVQKRFTAYVLRKIKLTSNGLAYAIVSRRASIQHNMKNIPTMVHVLNNITGVEVWTTLSYDFQFKKWKASLRSRNVEVNTIAREFGGGGHKTIAATVFSSKRDYYKLLARIDQYLFQVGYIQEIGVNKTRFSLSNSLIKFYRMTKYK